MFVLCFILFMNVYFACILYVLLRHPGLRFSSVLFCSELFSPEKQILPEKEKKVLGFTALSRIFHLHRADR